ncbi:MAG TPA: transaldolase family protein [Candidatus Dormibacteraeota bacterium]|nr:transaldolase family protein [Candidatus Dormibacteraeota bacterium]
MKIYLDSVRLTEIEAGVDRRCVGGVTTNPTFLFEEARGRPLAHLRRVVELLRPHRLPLSVQVMTTDPREMVRQADVIAAALAYPGLVVKVPCGWDELAVIAELAGRGVTVNGTACMTAMQAVMAAAAGARYVTLFYGKMTDAEIDAAAVVQDVATALRDAAAGCELLVASIRRTYDVHECMRRGAHAVTVTYRLLSALCEHPKTAEAIRLFAESFVPLDLSGPSLATPSPRGAPSPSQGEETRYRPASRGEGT